MLAPCHTPQATARRVAVTFYHVTQAFLTVSPSHIRPRFRQSCAGSRTRRFTSHPQGVAWSVDSGLFAFIHQGDLAPQELSLGAHSTILKSRPPLPVPVIPTLICPVPVMIALSAMKNEPATFVLDEPVRLAAAAAA